MSLYICLNPQNTQHQERPNVNYGLWVIAMCHCGFIDFNKCFTLEQNGDSGEGSACVGKGVIWEVCVPSTQFCSQPKIAVKRKVY